MKPDCDYALKLREFQRGYFGNLLKLTSYSVSEVARLSGIERSYLYRLLGELEIPPFRRYQDARRAA